MAQAHCTICHEQFATNGVADFHWTKIGHVHPCEVPKKLESRDEGHGVVWRTVGTNQHWTQKPVSTPA